MEKSITRLDSELTRLISLPSFQLFSAASVVEITQLPGSDQNRRQMGIRGSFTPLFSDGQIIGCEIHLNPVSLEKDLTPLQKCHVHLYMTRS